MGGSRGAMAALVDDAASGLHLPRTQAGSQPQHLLLTLLGDYFLDAADHIPSASLVSLLQEFGITSAGSRAALSRLSRRGLLSNAKTGRHTSYRLTEQAAAVLREASIHILRFGAVERAWSGRWTVVAFSVPEPERQSRPALRARLRWLGYAPLYDGVWISPHPPTDEVDRVLRELEIRASTVFVGEILERTGGSPPLSAWDLDQLRGVYTDFIAEFGLLRDRVSAGAVGAAEGLVARTTIMDRWRHMPNLDPELPNALLPGDWPRPAARRVFVDIYDGLGALAELRVRQILADFPGPAAPLASHHTSESFAR
ncbi:MAG: PaaX family transcriptional regulator [Acidimicrobiales bacterium]